MMKAKQGGTTAKKKRDAIMPVEKWVEEQRAALREERDEERTEVTTALAQLSPLVKCEGGQGNKDGYIYELT